MTENSDDIPGPPVTGRAGEDIPKGAKIVLAADGLWYKRHHDATDTRTRKSTKAPRRKRREPTSNRPGAHLR